MNNSKRNVADRVRSSGEHGSYDKYQWVEEAKSKLTSAKIMRSISQKKRNDLQKYMQGNSDNGRKIYTYDHPYESTTKSSFLLLGYAIELLLKSGVVSLCTNLPKTILDNQLKHYGHNLVKIANDLHISLEKNENSMLKDLSSFIVKETRYPVTAKSIADYCNKANAIRSKLSNDFIFYMGIDIYEKIHLIIEKIDGSQENPKTTFRQEIDDDGFFTFRFGGSIPPACIVKYSKYQVENCEDKPEQLKSLIQGTKEQCLNYQIMLQLWENTDFYRVKICKQGKEYFLKDKTEPNL